MESDAHPSTPNIKNNENKGFLKPFVSANAPKIGPNIATINVEVDIAYPQ